MKKRSIWEVKESTGLLNERAWSGSSSTVG